MNDLLKCGIEDKNIYVYDLHVGMGIEELCQYDVVYLCGGNTTYLLVSEICSFLDINKGADNNI